MAAIYDIYPSFDTYASDAFKKGFSIFLSQLKSPVVRRQYAQAAAEIMAFMKKDFMEADDEDAAVYVRHLECLLKTEKSITDANADTAFIRKEEENGYNPSACTKPITLKTLNFKIKRLHSIANFFLLGDGASFISLPEGSKNVWVTDHTKRHSGQYIKSRRIPTLSNIDNILKEASSDPMVYLAVVLSYRMCLSLPQILMLKTSDVYRAVSEDGAGVIRLKVYKKKPMSVPSDVFAVISSYIKQMPQNMGSWLFAVSNKARMNQDDFYARYRASVTEDFSMRDIRAAGIVSLTSSSRNIRDVSEYLDISVPWLLEYKAAGEKLVDADSLTNIRITDPPEKKEN